MSVCFARATRSLSCHVTFSETAFCEFVNGDDGDDAGRAGVSCALTDDVCAWKSTEACFAAEAKAAE